MIKSPKMNDATPPKLMPLTEQVNEASAINGPTKAPRSADASGCPSMKNFCQNCTGSQADRALRHEIVQRLAHETRFS